MIPQTFEYSAPANLPEALQLLAQGQAKPLAGGMSLIPLMKLRLASPGHLVDISRLPELGYIREEGGMLRIGGGATHYEIETSALVRSKSPLLAQTAAQIGDVQVRNVGTIGGSAAHADPAADYPAALLALEATFHLVSAGGERLVSAEQFFVDSFTTVLGPGEIIREIVVPGEEKATGTRYEKFVHPASGFAVVGVAVRIRKQAGAIQLARIGVTGVAARPYRAQDAERLLEGSRLSAATVQQAAASVAQGVEANSDLFASAEFRRHLARIYAARALTAALDAAR